MVDVFTISENGVSRNISISKRKVQKNSVVQPWKSERLDLGQRTLYSTALGHKLDSRQNPIADPGKIELKGTQVDLFRFFSHNICALLLGCLIGLERQWHRRNAGLRTNALVSLGAALFVSLSGLLFGTTDQSRIAAQVVSGIGFIGAGLLIREGINVSGLNTAATLWCAGAVGTLAGSGFVSEAAIGTGLVITTHLLLRPLGNILARRPLKTGDENLFYSLRIVCQGNAEQRIRAVVVQEMVREPLMLQSIESKDIEGTGQVEVKALVATRGRQDAKLEKMVGQVSLDQAVTAASWHAMAEQRED